MESKTQRSQDSSNRRQDKRWFNFSYTTKVTLAFVLIAAMTALVASGVLWFVWEQHFQAYTRENVQRTATNIASQISARYESSGSWNSATLGPADEALRVLPGVGIQVVSDENRVVYDSTRVDGVVDVSLAPLDASAIASAPISVGGQAVGSVRVWVYGSGTLLTESDKQFRAESYEAMVLASLIALGLAALIGMLFARGLVNPINRISKAAKSFGAGNLSARTGMDGEDEIARLGRTFDNMAESVEKDRELEHRLTTDVAHELRTPLMAVQSTVEAMIDGVFEADEERLDTVNSEVQRLSRLVDAILKLSRLENRSAPLAKEPVDVGELISGLVSAHEAFVQESGLGLDYTADDDVIVDGNPDLIRQAVANLISNAVRYTPEGGIAVSVKREGNNAVIAVADTGIGLSAEDAKMVFSRFWRADSGRNRESGGLGVGLAVVKEIVDQHGGQVRVQGEEGKGSTFSLVLPLFDEEEDTGRRGRRREQDRAIGTTFDEAWDEEWDSE